MKNLAYLAILFSMLLTACSTSYNASAPYDEVYATSADRPAVEKVTVTTSTVESTTAFEGDYYAPEYDQAEAYDEDFDSEAYYDYEYSSRIRRFHQTNPGFDYYDNYYTDVYYYNYDPYYMGSSIYSGCGYCGWGPSISLSYGWGGYYGWGGSFGYGYPYYRWWNDPWYGWGYGYGYYPGYWGYYPGSYYSGYWNGYYDGYWDGYWGGNYYPNDNNPYGGSHYGPRSSRGGYSNGSGTYGTASRDTRQDSGQPMEKSSRDYRVASNVPVSNVSGQNGQAAGNESKVTSDRGYRTVPESQEPEKAVAPKVSQPASRTATFDKPAASREVRESGTAKRSDGETVSPARRVEQPRYEKPTTYTPPTYRTTPSRQEYSSPSTRDTRGTTEQQGAVRRTYTQTPERRSSDMSSPAQNRNVGTQSAPATRDYTPARSNRESYSAPSKNYSAPSSSPSRNYSAPSSSPGRSYSAPSRSSSPSSGGGTSRSSGSSSSSGGSSSRGGRR